MTFARSDATPAEDFTAAYADFEADGFCVVRGFFTAEETARHADRLSRYLREIAPGLPDAEKFFEDKADPDSVIRLNNMHQHDPYFNDFLHEPRVLAFVRTMLRDEPVPRSLVLFGKKPNGGKPTPAHQDGNYYFLEPPHALMLWIPIDPATRQNGCVHYVKGSHRQGMREHEIGNTFGFSLGLTDYTTEDASREVAVEVYPGDLLAHHCLTIHRTDGNDSPMLRRAFGMAFFAKSVKVNEAGRNAHALRMHEHWRRQGKL